MDYVQIEVCAVGYNVINSSILITMSCSWLASYTITSGQTDARWQELVPGGTARRRAPFWLVTGVSEHVLHILLALTLPSHRHTHTHTRTYQHTHTHTHTQKVVDPR